MQNGDKNTILKCNKVSNIPAARQGPATTKISWSLHEMAERYVEKLWVKHTVGVGGAQKPATVKTLVI